MLRSICHPPSFCSSRSTSSAPHARSGAAAVAGGGGGLPGGPLAAGEAAAAQQAVAAPARVAGVGRPGGLLLPHELVDVLPPPGPRHTAAFQATAPPASRGSRCQLISFDSGNGVAGFL